MKLDEAKYAFESLKHRKMRSFLSVLSILIGIASIFAIISFGMGLQSYIQKMKEESGGDKLFIQAKGIGGAGTDDTFFLSQDDVDFIEKINGVNEISGLYMKPAEVIFNDQKKYNYLMGGDMGQIDFIEETFTTKLASGRNVKDGELYAAVLGYNYQVPFKIFDRAVRLGDKLEVNGKKIEVVGFYESMGNPQDDGNIYVSKETIEDMIPETKEKYGFIIARAEADLAPRDLAQKIQDRLRKHKNQEEGEEDFFVQTFEDAIATFETILSVLNGILILIALISVVVAAVNIMNTMYTAVLERTGEIGIMKAVGARNSDILFVFVFESGLLGLMGGVIGVILGYLIAKIGGQAAAAAGFSLLSPIFPPGLIIGCLIFAFLVGTGAGLLPALRASKLKPVEALRYE